MKALLLGLVIAAPPLQAAVLRQTIDDTMTRGKLAADLGDHVAATRAFKAVADDASAPAALRIEARVRLGSTLRSAGDHEGALAAFQRAAKDPAIDRATKALLVQAVGGALPGAERWETVWARVTFVVDRSDPRRPGLAIRWPDAEQVKVDYKGEVVDVEFKDGDIVDVMRFFGAVGGVNVLIDPAVQGSVTVKLKGVPWEQALDTIVRQHGLTWHRDDRVLSVSRSGRLTAPKKYTGEPITLDFKNGDLQDVMRLFSDISELNVVLGPLVGGKVSLKLNEMPWDQVFDIIKKMHGLSSRREGNVLWVSTGWMPPVRSYSGKPVDVDMTNKEVLPAFEEIAKAAAVELVVSPETHALLADSHWLGPRLLTLKLNQVPGDQALDLAARLSQLALDREGTRFTVRSLLPKRFPSRREGGFASFRINEVQVRGVLIGETSGHVGFVMGPDGKTYFPRVGQKLADGSITAINGTSVTFQEQLEGGGTREVMKPIQTVEESGSVLREGRDVAAPAPRVELHRVGATNVGDLVKITDAGVVSPVLIKKVVITKPEKAVLAKVQGTVLVAVLVDENGKPAEVELLQKFEHPEGRACNEAALEGVKQMEWQPATKDGVRVKTWITVKIPFL